MPITWVRGTPDQFQSSPFRAIEGVTNGFNMGALVEDAANLMKEYTATRPSAKSGKPGRIDTGRMIDAIKSRVSVNGGNIVGEFGFLDSQEPYFMYQTGEGFTHYLSGDFIPGTLALMDAGTQAQEEFIRRLSEALSR